MRFPHLVPATFLDRPNRFRAVVRVNGEHSSAHVASPGRMEELLLPGRRVWLKPAAAPHRVTDYDLKLVEHDGHLVSVDSRLPNALFAEALERGRIDFARPYPEVRAEVRRGASRLDFRLSGTKGDCWVEVKSVNLVEDGIALFPDAPTVRGRRHVLELAEIAAEGGCAAAVFVIQRSDPEACAPHALADPDLAQAIAYALARGVILRAYTCDVSLSAIQIVRRVPFLAPCELWPMRPD